MKNYLHEKVTQAADIKNQVESGTQNVEIWKSAKAFFCLSVTDHSPPTQVETVPDCWLLGDQIRVGEDE